MIAVSGDTVHAASGTYAQGSRAPGGCTVAARAHVPAGVTLEGAGADKTFVVGAAAASPDAYGRGNDAVRCVYLEKGACVRGCALTGGHTRSGWSDGNAASTDWHGAGACGAASTAEDVAATRVEDCVVSNCVAICGGAGYNVTFVRSRLFKCFATRGSATERCGLENSIVDDMDSDGSSGLCVNNAFQVVNVTIGRNIRNKDGGDGYFGKLSVSEDALSGVSGTKEVLLALRGREALGNEAIAGVRVIIHNHNWTGWTQTKAPTVFAEGVSTGTCTVCGEKSTKPIAKLKPVIKVDWTAATIAKTKAPAPIQRSRQRRSAAKT